MAATESKAQELLPGPRKPRRNPAANVLRVREGRGSGPLGSPLRSPVPSPAAGPLFSMRCFTVKKDLHRQSHACHLVLPHAPLVSLPCFPPLCFPHSSAFRLHVVCPLPELAADFPSPAPLHRHVICPLPELAADFPGPAPLHRHVVCPLPELAADFRCGTTTASSVLHALAPGPGVEPECALEQQPAAFPPSVLWLSPGCVPLHMPGCRSRSWAAHLGLIKFSLPGLV